MAAVLCHGCGMAFDPPEGYARCKIQCPGCGVICVISPDAERAVPQRMKPVAAGTG
jgi:rubredoxin